MTSPLTRLTVQRLDDQDVDGRHVVLSLQPEVTTFRDAHGRPSVPGLDLDDDRQWQAFVIGAFAVAGTLARIAVDVAPDVILCAQHHGCDWRPYPRPQRDFADGEIAGASWDGDGCGLWLSATSTVGRSETAKCHTCSSRFRATESARGGRVSRTGSRRCNGASPSTSNPSTNGTLRDSYCNPSAPGARSVHRPGRRRDPARVHDRRRSAFTRIRECRSRSTHPSTRDNPR